ncbi:MFS transporter [Humisphaera borealis]|uniref:MFS transporter n=1 Tax=Humisphaera borealis TaxID=2807512 RepID=A0A7M2WRE8_9BACT|nr:MFS transporter [Humisphaera borealis]QOV87824.1 MFS transporter [Humisphaera borealis]
MTITAGATMVASPMPTLPRRQLLILLSFVAFISLGLPDGVLGVAWPFMRHDFDLPISRLGWFLSFGVAGYLISSFFAGQLVRWIGVGRILLFSTVLVAASLTGYALSPRWEVILPLALCVGLGSGAIDAALNVFVASAFPARIVSWLHAFYGVGATIGPIAMTAAVTTVTFASPPGWRWGYASLAILQGLTAVGFATTLSMWRTMPSAAGVPSGPQSPVDTKPVLEADAVAGTAETLRHPVVRLHVLTYFIYAGTEVTAGQWLFSLLLESRSLSPATCGAAVTVFWASLTAGRIAFGQAAERFSAVAILRLATCLAPIAAGLMCVRSGGAPLAIMAAGLLGFSLAPMFPMWISLTPARVGERLAAQAIGFQVSAATVGVAVLPSIAGWLARNVGLESIPVFLMATTVALLFINGWTARKVRDAERRPPAVRPQTEVPD